MLSNDPPIQENILPAFEAIPLEKEKNNEHILVYVN